MTPQYRCETTFEKNDYTTKALAKGEYDCCIFANCDFSNSDLSEIKFLECEFMNCNLSNAKINDTSFQDVKFKNCKMLGLQFDTCNDFAFSVNFDSCQLNHSSFYNVKLMGTCFTESQLEGVDLIEADLKNAQFDHCDLLDASFENSNLEKTDLRDSYNYSIDPDRNKLKSAKFSLPDVIGLLDKYDIEID